MGSEDKRNLQWLRQKVSRYLNFNSTQTDQDFAGSVNDPNALIDDFINEAYRTECNEVMNETSVEHFREVITDSWPQGQLLYILPSFLDPTSILAITDISSSSRGIPLLPQREDMQTRIFWKDQRTLQYDTTGPGSDLTIQIAYLGQPSEMKDDTDEPYLIPYKFRDLLTWSAVVIARSVGDEAPPKFWVDRRDELRAQLALALSKGKPLQSGPPRIRNRRLHRFF